MSRHAKNNTSAPVFTYYERSRLKYGTQKQRVGKDSLKHFDSCCLCLQPVVDPLCCLQGHLFCKECIYECLLAQQKDIKRQKKLWEAQQQELKEQAETTRHNAKEAEIAAFDRVECGLLPQVHQVFRPAPEDNKLATPAMPAPAPGSEVKMIEYHGPAVIDAEKPEEKPQLRSFWVPSLTPSAANKLIEKPKKDTYCTEGNHPIRLKQLIPVKFIIANKEDDTKCIRNGRYCCPVCRRELTDAPKAVILRSCGHVMCLGCCEKFKDEKICTACDVPYRESDVIKMQSGGTGFSGHDENLIAKKITPSAWM